MRCLLKQFVTIEREVILQLEDELNSTSITSKKFRSSVFVLFKSFSSVTHVLRVLKKKKKKCCQNLPFHFWIFDTFPESVVFFLYFLTYPHRILERSTDLKRTLTVRPLSATTVDRSCMALYTKAWNAKVRNFHSHSNTKLFFSFLLNFLCFFLFFLLSFS